MIELDSVRKVFTRGGREVAALDGISLRIDKGEFVSVVGKSGSGKSTFLHLVGLLDLPTSGSVRLDGVESSAMSDDERSRRRREQIGIVFQFFHLIPTLRVFENVGLPLLLGGARQADVARRVDGLLERVGVAERRAHYPEELSGGEMQRVAIARALVADPPLLLADEPTGNLDSATGCGILDCLREVGRSPGRTVVLVTHDPAAAAVGTRILTLHDGRIHANAP
jgi:putative ABC transport system ATP-binding protein